MRRVLIPETLAPVGRDGASQGAIEQLSGWTMGTTWSVRFVRPPGFAPGRLHERISAELSGLVSDLSHWDADSALCRFNRAPAGSREVLPDALFAVLAAASDVARRSEGACDPTLGALVDLWGFGPPGPVIAPPDQGAIAEALGRSGWQNLALDSATLSAVQPGGIQLDLSGIAKGYAVDRLSDLLSAQGLPSHLVEIGGEVRGRGLKPNREPWWVVLEAPVAEGATGAETVVALHDLAVATSGEYRRFLEHGGRRLGHSLDPVNGRPVENGLISVSVLHRSCMLADAFATAFMVLGSERALALAARDDLAVRLVAQDGPRVVERFSAKAQRMLA